MTPADLLGGVILAALVVYALLGGADFGGGIWDLLATGPRAPRAAATWWSGPSGPSGRPTTSGSSW